MKKFLTLVLMAALLVALPVFVSASEKPWQPADLTVANLFTKKIWMVGQTTDTTKTISSFVLAQINRGYAYIRATYFNQRSTMSAPTTSNSGLMARSINLPQPFT